MKHLAASHVVEEKGPYVYSGTPLSNSMTEPRFRDGLIYTYVHLRIRLTLKFFSPRRGCIICSELQLITVQLRCCWTFFPCSARVPQDNRLQEPHRMDQRPIPIRTQNGFAFLCMARSEPTISLCFQQLCECISCRQTSVVRPRFLPA